MKVAVVGATGLVGSTMLQLLAERNFPITELIPVASAKSKGKKVTFKGKEFEVVTPEEAIEMKPTLAIFSAGGTTSLEYAEKFAAIDCFVVDNSSAWRMDPTKKLIIPEVNADVLTINDKVIANPNCSTIQMLMVLKPLHDAYGIKRVIVSTYQSVTGSGQKGISQLEHERANEDCERCYAHQIDMNIIPHIDSFLDNGYTKEEMKMVNETRKIMGNDSIRVTATTVRVPVEGGHSESVNIEFENDFELSDVKTKLAAMPGVIVQDDVQNNLYPMPINAFGKDEVFVGRIRRDESQPNTLNCWIVADNLRKGAATNAIQIAEYLVKKGFIK